MSENVFIVLEGGDGSGKTSVRKSIFRHFHSRNLDIIAIPPLCWLDRNATRTITALKFLDDPIPQQIISQAYASDKQLLVANLIEPQLLSRSVVCDRYLASDIVYHYVMWNIPIAASVAILRQRRLTRPDLTVFLDVAPEVAMERLRRRGSGVGHKWDTPEHQHRIRDCFASVFASYSDLLGKTLIFDNSGDFESLDDRVVRTILAPLGFP